MSKKRRRSGGRSWPRDGERSAGGEPPVVRLVSYEVTCEPLHIGPPKPPEVEEQYRELHDLCFDRPAEAVRRIEGLVAKYPKVPELYNLLAAAYGRAGRFDESDRVIERNYRDNPGYLFALVNYADLCLSRGDVEAVPRLLGNRFDLKLLYPDRNVFHVSEVITFLTMLGRYHLMRGEFEPAENAYKVVKKLAPDHRTTAVFKDMMARAVLEKATSRLTTPRRRGPGRPGKGPPNPLGPAGGAA